MILLYALVVSLFIPFFTHTMDISAEEYMRLVETEQLENSLRPVKRSKLLDGGSGETDALMVEDQAELPHERVKKQGEKVSFADTIEIREYDLSKDERLEKTVCYYEICKNDAQYHIEEIQTALQSPGRFTQEEIRQLKEDLREERTALYRWQDQLKKKKSLLQLKRAIHNM